MKVAFVTNFCPHYRVGTFETLARRLDVELLFFSGGGEWYWQTPLGVRRGDFPHTYLRGFSIAGTRITPALIPRLLSRRYAVVVKDINGRFALPAAYLAARLSGKPFVLWTGIWQRLTTPAHRLLWPLTRWIYRHADAVVTYGEHVARYLESEGVAAERLFPSHHAVDNDAYRRPVPDDERQALRRRLDVPPDAPVVLYLGRMEPEKGLNDLLAAFADAIPRLPAETVLLLVGEGSMRPELELRARTEPLAGRVRFVDRVSPEETTPFYALAELLVLPSVPTPAGREPWGLVVNEAMNQAVPVLASDAVGAAAGGLVEHDVTGWVVPAGDRAALTEGLAAVLTDEPRRRRLGRTARKRVARWSDERMVDAFQAAVESVTGESPPGDPAR